MESQAKIYRTRPGKREIYYYRCRLGLRRKERCSNNKCVRADKAHKAVWELVSGLLKDPDRLRTGLEAMIEKERRGMRGDPEGDKKQQLYKLAELTLDGDGYRTLLVEGLLSPDELRAKLVALEEARGNALREIAALERRGERVVGLERDRDVFLESYTRAMPKALDNLSPEQRHHTTNCSGWS